METVAQGVNWHSASAFLKQKTSSAGYQGVNPSHFPHQQGRN
jgi:hypothetical protein